MGCEVIASTIKKTIREKVGSYDENCQEIRKKQIKDKDD